MFNNLLFLGPLIKASSAANLSFLALSERPCPHLSSDRLREAHSEMTQNCLRFRLASFNERFL